FLLVAATSRVDRIGSRANRVRVIALALVLAAIGADAFTPWMYAVTTRMPAPLSLQPAPLIWLGVYGGVLVATIVWVGSVAGALDRAGEHAGGIAACCVGALFAAMLALIMNGFSSLRPLDPWGGLAMAAGSAAATAFALAAVVAATPPGKQ